MRLNGSPIFYIVLGSLWLVAAVLKAIEKPMFVGPVYWPIVIYGAVGVCFYAFAIVVIVKQRRQNKKSEKEFSHKRVARVVGTIMILAVAVGYCLIMANRYQSYSLDCVSTDTKKILNEMPFLEFTEEEMAVFSEIFENPSVAAYKGNGEQTIPAEEIRVLVNDVIPAGAVNVSAAIYDVQGENDSKESSLLQIKYVADELEFCVDCYDMGSIEKIVAKNSGKIIYANENNEHFEKYVQRRNWFAWMISPGNASSRSGKLLYD